MAYDKAGQRPKGTSKLDEAPLNWRRAILRLHWRGKSLGHIQTYLKKQYGYNISIPTLSAWFKNQAQDTPNVLFQKEAYTKELENSYVETLREYKKMVQFTWELVEDMKKCAKQGTVRDKSEVLKGVAEIRMQIELAQKLLGELPKGGAEVIDVMKNVGATVQKMKELGLLDNLEKQRDEMKKEAEAKANTISVRQSNGQTLRIAIPPEPEPPEEDSDSNSQLQPDLS
jgi:chaperonin cofactor prefoldin